MNELHAFLATVWFILLGLTVTLYGLLDGFELGTSILSLMTPSSLTSEVRLSSHNPWTLNEIWLLLSGGILFGAFPPAFEMLTRSMPLALVLLLLGLLIRRAGAIYSHFTGKRQLAHNLCGWGSLLVTLMLGLLAAAIYSGLHTQPTLAGLLLEAGVPLIFILLGAFYLYKRRRLFSVGQTLLVLGLTELALSMYPDIIPDRITLEQAATSNPTLMFMILGISLLLPLMLAYNAAFQFALSNKHESPDDTHTTPPNL